MPFQKFLNGELGGEVDKPLMRGLAHDTVVKKKCTSKIPFKSYICQKMSLHLLIQNQYKCIMENKGKKKAIAS